MFSFGGVHFYRLQSFQIADTNEKMVSVTTLAAVRSFFDRLRCTPVNKHSNGKTTILISIAM